MNDKNEERATVPDKKPKPPVRRTGLLVFHPSALLLFFYDMVSVAAAYFLALFLRFDGNYTDIPPHYLLAYLRFLPVACLLAAVCFLCLHLYRSLWRFASFDELLRVLAACFLSGLLHAVLITLFYQRMPLSYYLFGAGLFCLFALLVRFSYRFVLLERGKRQKAVERALAKRVLLIGAGSAGQMLLRDIRSASQVHDLVVAMIDDDRAKWGRSIDGVPIVGGRDDILLACERYGIEKIYLAIPSAPASARRDILAICKETGCELKTLPGMYELVTGKITATAMQEVKIEHLLGREPVRVEMDEIFAHLEDKVILVTGGGGSIGSELCRQIAAHAPRQLIILDIYENNAHAIALELRDRYPSLALTVLIGSVRDSRRLRDIFSTYRPDVVYHAAAHKHVPLMEDSPCEAIKNNAAGTYKTAFAAMTYGCRRFVLVSTDKAVNPTNVMGASKRLCEMIVQTFDKKVKKGDTASLGALFSLGEHFPAPAAPPATEFVAVRFGNVLGSNGSVVPRFREQIAKGGPVTVTHPDIIRYFMTIPEAASLVLQAGTYAGGGEIFVLDMGEPVKIDALARNLIRLSGLVPDVDIPIVYTGLRPGEKLFEEKLMSEEGLRTTKNALIHIGNPIPFDEDAFLSGLASLAALAAAGDEPALRRTLAEVVTTYHPT